MPRKITYSREKIVELTFDLLRKEGIHSLSARNIGKKLGMSSMIIYSNFQNMDELLDLLLQKSKKLLVEYQMKKYSPYKIFNTGFGYIQFALSEKILFKWMFQEENGIKQFWKYLFDDMYEEIFPELENVVGKGSSKKKLYSIFEDLWIYVHGFAMLLNSKTLVIDDEKIIEQKLMALFQNLTGIS